ncbi:MFS transporter [Desulfopila sp. IMCC35006]|uniref:MFS transporter n=1 Tax=Desulfopila sp. IMCC35006 TaxID=2569542 RepID=UPI0010AC7B7F|nr:MFS transporter [Desulfopila sp. IMCC35006]TKB28057.1 MFS transporter [Desulfopila sp. IMCC35006]
MRSTPSQSVLLHRPFMFYLCARAITYMAFQMLGVAVGWQIYAITGSAMYLGLVGLAQFLPMFLLTLVVGQVADQYDRRNIARTCQVIEAIATGVLALASFSGWQSKESILLMIFIIGAARAFEGPTLHALLPRLVPANIFPQAAAWSASAMQTATIIGPAVGGFLYTAGPTAVYMLTGTAFLSAGLCMTLLRIERQPLKHEPVTLRSVLAGISFIRSRREVLGAISLDLFAVLLGGATALLPIYARDILATGPWGLGLLRSAPAVGALTMSIFLARRPLRHRVGITMFRAVAVFGAATILFAVSTSFLLSFAMLVILGASDVISVVIRQSLVQLKTPDEMRGRVSAVNSMFIGTSNQLGEFESGVTAALFGPVPAVLLGGIGTIIVVLVWIRLFPQLAAVDTLET